MESAKPNDQTNSVASDQPGDSATFQQRRAEWGTWDKQQTRQHMMLLVIGQCIAAAVFVAVAFCVPHVHYQRPWLVVFTYVSCIVVWLSFWPIVVLHWKSLTYWGRKRVSSMLFP